MTVGAKYKSNISNKKLPNFLNSSSIFFDCNWVLDSFKKPMQIDVWNGTSYHKKEQNNNYYIKASLTEITAEIKVEDY